ncbi:ArsR/SmtB family transcription factor [Halogranum rubrum]|uniref:Uncharacterized protein n=1 Tax=Halogranum salarium B-1 TaxID=1210908 RepID=J3JED4_9EURY|nr:helix-turn-helix domain-containing protein [Halogranum salarium]EJN58264.1 hypothetical protein HSB1_36810 [Halogranum salarium B-1]
MADFDSTRTEVDRRVAPADAFGAIANETRLAILRALWEAPERPVSFSELRASVGMRDSAQFNYHLRQLTDHFVRKTDEGYSLRAAGKGVVRALVVGTFTEDPRRDPFPVGSDCVHCGEPLHAHYADESLTVDCTACERVHSRHPFPPGGLLGRGDDALLDAYERWVRGQYALVAAGICPVCGSELRTELVTDADRFSEDGAASTCRFPEYDTVVLATCDRCIRRVGATVGMRLLSASAVAEFYRDHGLDLSTIPYWELPWAVSDRHTTVLNDDGDTTDPWRVCVTIPLDDEVLRVTLDRDFDIVSTDRLDQESV